MYQKLQKVQPSNNSNTLNKIKMYSYNKTPTIVYKGCIMFFYDFLHDYLKVFMVVRLAGLYTYSTGCMYVWNRFDGELTGAAHPLCVGCTKLCMYRM